MPPKRERRREADPESQAVRRGLRDYALAKDGSTIHVRSWDPTRQVYHYTRLGKEWIRGRRVDSVVLLPVTISTHGRDGRRVEYYGFSPVSSLQQQIDRPILRATENDEGKGSVKANILRLMQQTT